MAPIQEVTLSINGVPLHLRRAGENGPGLAFVHGWGDSSIVWRRSLGYWGARYRTVALDQPGHGGSALLPDAATIAPIAAHLAAAIEQLAVAPVALVGHSFGGLLSLRLALDFPHLVERLVLVNPSWSGKLPFPIPLLYPQAVGLPALQMAHPARLLLVRVMGPLLDRMGEQQQEQINRWRAYTQAEPSWLYRAMLLTATDLRAEVKKLAKPALVIVGPRDLTVAPRWTRRLADYLAHARLVEIPQAGHHPMEDDFAAFRAAVDAFLQPPAT